MNREERKKTGEYGTGKRLLALAILAGIVTVVLLVSLVGEGLIQVQHNRNAAQETVSPVVLKLDYAYQNPQWDEQVEQTIKAFEEENPDVRIQYDPAYSSRVYEDTLIKKIALSELGDIVQLKNPAPYVEAGLIGTLPESLAQNLTYCYEEKGSVYGAGAVRATSGILYNQELFDRLHLNPPKNYKEFLAICETLNQNGITPIAVGGGDLWHMEYWINHFFREKVLTKNPDWLKDAETGKASWADPEITEMIEALTGLFSSGYINADWRSTTDLQTADLLAKGEAAMVYTGPWTAQTVQKMNPSFQAGWFFLPDEEGTTVAADNQDVYWAVWADWQADEARYEAALRFLEYFYSKENYSRVLNGTVTSSAVEGMDAAETTEFRTKVWADFAAADERITAYIGDADTPQNFEKELLLALETSMGGDLSKKKVQSKLTDSWEETKNG
jgi:raffinose/stachyose/melibiose transport system substrate-binding protein